MSESSNAEPFEAPSWEQVARDHGQFVYTIAYRLTGNHDDAQDLVQEVLLRVKRGLATYRPGSMEGWLSRITTNAFLDEMRRRKRRPAVPTADLSDRVGTGTDPEEVIASTRLPDDVQAALLSLPPDFRAAVVLRDVVGLDYEEMAETLNIPAGTVRSRIHRGRALLRDLLSDRRSGPAVGS